MRKSSFLLASMALALLLVSGVAWAELSKAAYWQMDETEGQMLDSSGNNNNSTIDTPKNVVQGVEEDIDGDGGFESTYGFNGSITTPSRVAVPDADSLDPQANDITLTARVKVNGESLDDDSYDIVRKGFITTPGGDYKMEIKRVKSDPSIGRLHCFFRGIQEDGTDDSVKRVARPDIVDGNWHTLQCVKTSNSVVASVDGRSFTTTGSADAISNAENVIVGAKKVTQTRRGGEKGDDVFDGWMDFVSIEIAQ